MIVFPTDEGLPKVRAEALAAVARAAAALEAEEVPTPARSAIYAEKEQQAKAVLSAEEPDPADYDLVRRDMIVDGLSLVAAAEAIVEAAARLRAIAGPLEEWRRGRNAAIAAATTVAEVRAIDVSVDSLMAAIAAEQT